MPPEFMIRIDDLRSRFLSPLISRRSSIRQALGTVAVLVRAMFRVRPYRGAATALHLPGRQSIRPVHGTREDVIHYIDHNPTSQCEKLGADIVEKCRRGCYGIGNMRCGIV